jgi:hypothetical protein
MRRNGARAVLRGGGAGDSTPLPDYLNPDRPLRTIPEAAKQVTESKGSGPTVVLIAPGPYALDRTALFKPERHYFRRRPG